MKVKSSLLKTPVKLSVSFSVLFNKSFNFFSPNPWKETLVTPIFKKGSCTVASYYRPINLTSESIIRDKNNHKVHGYKQLICSLPTWLHRRQILRHTTACCFKLNEAHSIDMIYFNFAKAFDYLLTKLKSYGLTGNLLGWLKSFLVV